MQSDLFSLRLQRLKENGYKEEDEDRPLRLDHLQTAFIILMIGCGLSIFTFIGEIWYYKHNLV